MKQFEKFTAEGMARPSLRNDCCNFRRLRNANKCRRRLSVRSAGRESGPEYWSWCVWSLGVSTGRRVVGIICLHLSLAASQVATCSPNQLSYARCSPFSFFHKMNFEDVEERDGVYFIHFYPGGFISCFFRHSTVVERLALISH